MRDYPLGANVLFLNPVSWMNKTGKKILYNKRLVSAIFLLVMAYTAKSQPDFETIVPSNFTVAKGSLSISDRHYRLGQKSLRWDWQAGDTLHIELSASETNAINTGLDDWSRGHFEVWVHNETASKDTFEFQFLNSAQIDRYRFRFNINYHGWRRLLRAYINDMLQKSGNMYIGHTVYLLAPKTGSGTIYIDNLQYMRNYGFKQSDDVMPDLYALAPQKDYLTSEFYYKAYYATSPDENNDPTPAEIKGLDSVKQRIRRAGIGVAPSASELSAANSAYSGYNIVVSGSTIKGKIINDPSEIGDMLATFTRSYIHNNNTDSRDKAINLIKLMFDSGIAGGSGLWFGGGNQGYYQMKFFNALINLDAFADVTLRSEIRQWLKWCTGVGLGRESDTNGLFDVDDIFTLYDAFISIALFSNNDADGVNDLRRLKAYLDKFLTDQKGVSDGIKVDGTNFHHSTHYNAYMYAMRSLIMEILAKLRGTPFQISVDAYKTLRKAAYAESLMSNNIYYANSLSGRHPFDVITYYTDDALKELAYIGGEVNNTTVDPIVAGIYSRMYGYAPKINGIGAESFPSGFWQMNYSPLAMYRRDTWAATIKGINKSFWATETYPTENRYGRYQGYGALEILYPSVWPNKLAPSGMIASGWDWNKVPGTTSIIYPFDSLNTVPPGAELYERSQLNFAGGVKFGIPSETAPSDIILQDLHGDYGMYGLNFKQSNLTSTHSSSFVFRKSYFFFGRRIVCVGSNINNNRSWRNTITTLFQGSLPTVSTAITVDGSAKTGFPFSQTLSKTSSHWLRDAYGTGYYVLSGNTVQVEKKSQTSPDQSGNGATTTANYSNAYIDHGMAPKDGQYAYVVIPKTTDAAMSQFASNMSSPSTREFDILQQDSSAHIIRENATGVTGYSLFGVNTNLTSNDYIKGNDVPCMAMLQVKDDTMTISVVNPDMRFVNNESVAVPITIRFYGGWIKASNKPAKHASFLGTEDNETVVQFNAADGVPAEIVLARVSGVLPLRSLSLAGTVNEVANQNELTLKFENNESGNYTLEHKVEENGAWQVLDEKQMQGAASEQSYTFYHHNPVSGTNLYRIKWYGNGNSELKYSNIVQLKNALANTITVAPNPASNFFSVILAQKPSRPILWTLTDAGGRVVLRGKISDSRTDIAVYALSAGVYFLNMDNNKNFRIAVIK